MRLLPSFRVPLPFTTVASARKRVVAVFLIAIAVAMSGTAQERSARAAVHLLDYIAQDYAGAVQNGRVVSAAEYAEMLEFSATVVRMGGELPPLANDPSIAAELHGLVRLIEERANPDVVARHAHALRKQIVERAHLATAPASWPNLDEGRALYQQACAVCHGAEGRGDGSAASALDPRPANFHDDARMSAIAPFQAYNTIRIGLQGTAMPSFESLSDEQAWGLAFYVTSLRHRQTDARPAASTPIPLEVAASESDQQIERRLTGSAEERKRALATIRLHRGAAEHADTFSTAIALLGEADAHYRAGKRGLARDKALAAYLDGIEPMEPRVRASAPELVVELERDMARVRSAIESNRSASAVSDAVRSATATIREARRAMETRKSSSWVVFSIAWAIVLREGFESVLIIIAILTVLRGLGARGAARWVHAGWMAAVAVGLAAWLASGWLLGWSGLKRELLEAVTALFAVVMLLYMGFWLHRRTEIAKWKAFVEQQVSSALGRGSRFGLAFIAFLGVFREALETVLFLLALSVEGGTEARTFMAAGVLAAFACTMVLAWFLIRFSARLPLRTIFGVTAALMIALSVVLAGKGLRALQEVGALGVTILPFDFRVDLFGLYPTAETLLAQAIIAIVAAILWTRGGRRANDVIR